MPLPEITQQSWRWVRLSAGWDICAAVSCLPNSATLPSAPGSVLCGLMDLTCLWSDGLDGLVGCAIELYY